MNKKNELTEIEKQSINKFIKVGTLAFIIYLISDVAFYTYIY